MSVLQIPTAEVFEPLLQPARYKGAYGGRGSGKSHFFAGLLIDDCVRERGLLSLCVRETQRSLAQSSKRLLESTMRSMNVMGEGFKIWHDRIETPGDGVIIFQGMQDHTAETVKSFEGFKRCWIEEAQAFSERSLTLLRPTIRAEGSEIWASWNPRRKSDAVDKFFRGGDPVRGAAVVQANWRDNPWFPKELDEERKLDLQRYPDRYPHIWEGEYAKALEGAYFAKELAECRAQGRIGKVAKDPLLAIRAYWDIGGSGKNSDAMSIWIAQFVGREIRVLDYFEGQGQVLGYYTDWLRRSGWANAECILPHDGMNRDNVVGKTFQTHLQEAGFEVPEPIKNQGMGAAMMRVSAARRLFPQIWFNETTTEAGRDALGFYHERRDEARDVGLGPEHDWSSHAADAFGLMCVAYEEPKKTSGWKQPAASWVV